MKTNKEIAGKRTGPTTLMLKAALAGAIAASLPGHAQEVPRTAGGGNKLLEEVFVTAQRREQNLQEVPISMMALSGANLADRGVTNIKAITNYTPNVEFGNTNRPTAGGAAYGAWIRGVGTGDYAYPTDPGVGLYIDGVYVARTLGGLLSIADIERIEVLRGPQGTLYGRNTIGGAVNVITNKPILSGAAEGSIEGRFGKYNQRDVIGRINTPVIENELGFKAALASFNSDGHGKSLFTGKNLNDEERLIALAGLLWQPSEKLSIDIRGDYSTQKNAGPVAQMEVFTGGAPLVTQFNQIAAPIQNAQFGLPAGSVYDQRFALKGKYDSWAGSPRRDDFRIVGGSVTVEYEISETTALKSITAYRSVTTDVEVDGDNTPYLISTTDEEIDDTSFSQELQLTGQFWNEKVNYVAGLFYFDGDGESDKYSRLFHGIYEQTGNPTTARDTLTYQDYRAKSYAAFTQFDIALTNTVELTLGARYNRDEKDFSVQVDLPQLGTNQIPMQTQSASWTSFTPKVGINWKVTDDTMIYSSYSSGFKSGGFGNPTATMAAPVYDPEKLKTVEAGVKTALLDERITLNFAGFYTIWDEIQLNTIVTGPTGGIVNLTANAGKARLHGFELDLSARPTDQFRLNLGLGYTHNEFTDLSPNVAGVTLDTKLPHVPEWTATIGAQYNWSATIGEFMFRTDFGYRTKQYLTIADKGSLQDGYGLLSARFSYTPASMPNLELGVEGSNLLDKHYLVYEQAAGVFGVRLSQPGDPRMVAATIKYSF